MPQQVKVCTYKRSGGRYLLDKWFSLETMESHMEKMLNAGWVIQSENMGGGQTNIGQTGLKALLTGGLSLPFGDSRNPEKIVVTFTKEVAETRSVAVDGWNIDPSHLDEANALIENFKREALRELENIPEDAVALFDDGLMDSSIEEMHERGELDMTVTNVDDASKSFNISTRYSTGELKMEGFQAGDGNASLRTGMWTFYWLNGQKMLEGAFITGLKNGPFTYWHPSGVVFRTGTYCNGSKVGKWTRYEEDGRINETGVYKRGKKDGIWTETDETGKLYERSYKRGVPQ